MDPAFTFEPGPSPDRRACRPLVAVDLRALRAKYERIYALRELHARASAEPAFEEPEPRRAMADLAEQFPGSLRELDRLPLEVIAARVEALVRAAEDTSKIEPWMTAQAVFHRLARGALVAKRWLAGRRHVTDADHIGFREALATSCIAPEAAPFAGDLEQLARPPRGRVMDVVYAKTAKVLGLTEAEARALVLDAPRAERSRCRHA